MEITLTEDELRILGSLIEKALSTPDYYPLSLNALTNACNQKSNREPVVAYDENTIIQAIDRLEKKGLLRKSGVGRVLKYEELFTAKRDLVSRESAVLCVLFLRGPQTAGEIRLRTSRMHAFEDLEALHATLTNLEEWGYIHRLPRLPGHKESRYAHLLSGEPISREEPSAAAQIVQTAPSKDRMAQMEQDIAALKADLAALKSMVEALQKSKI